MTDYLFAMPSFARGLARTLDIGAFLSGSSYNLSPTPSEADAWALEEDWRAVGEDLRQTFDAFRPPDGTAEEA